MTGPRYRLTQSTVGALGLAGRMTDMASEYRFHVAAEPHHTHEHPLAAVAVGPWWVANNVLAGRIDVVRAVLAERYDESVTIGDDLARSVWALPAAIERWAGGDLIAAEQLAREALGIDASIVSIRRIATHFLMRILQLQGRHADVLALAPEAFGDDYVDLVRDWGVALVAISQQALDPTVAVGPSRDDAVRRVLTAASAMADRGQIVAAAYVLHDALRLGTTGEIGGKPGGKPGGEPGGEAIVQLVARLERHCDAPVVGWIARHADALALDGAASLEQVGHEAATAGHLLVARLALVDARAAALAQRDGRTVDRVDGALVDLDARMTGWPDVGDDPATTLGLSTRELEVARTAAAGLTDREIADALVISVRTVHAHLRSIYRKLEVHRRTDLTAIPGLARRDPDGR